MPIERWTPQDALSPQEQRLLKRLDRVRKLLGFLRLHRRRLFDDEFQAELERMYRDTGAGKDPVPPALMAMAMLVQAYLGVSDAEMVELTVVDLRVQMVLGCLGAVKPAFSQGALCDFRDRLIRTDLDRRVLERTVEVARETGEFDHRKLPRTLRLAVDSSPFEGAGRVEDTFNLLGHAARKLVRSVAGALGCRLTTVAERARAEIFLAPSIKVALDVDWSDPKEKARALTRLEQHLDHLERWVERHVSDEAVKPHLATLRQVRAQDLEATPRTKQVRIRQGVAHDRRVSIEDAEMRHGRKSSSYAFNGYKRHIAADLDTGLIVAAAVTPANLPEQTALPALHDDLDHQHVAVSELYIDRGYIASDFVEHVLAEGGEVICRPWQFSNQGLFSKTDFAINIRDRTITCPEGQTKSFQFGSTVEFDPRTCGKCSARSRCTRAARGTGRQVRIASDEALQQRLRGMSATPIGRARLRERVPVEHRLAHIANRQGNRARFRGVRKNTFDLRRAASIQNLEAAHRFTAADAYGGSRRAA